jgi:hypothetical protein
MQNRQRQTARALSLRHFGSEERDLAVDFAATPRPLLVTEILELCAGDDEDARAWRGRDFFWDLTVGARVEALLTIAEASEGRPGVNVTLHCPAADCAQELELELTLAELAELNARGGGDEHVAVRCGRETFKFRRPRGRDQLAWLGGRFEDGRAAERAMLRTLVVEEGTDFAARFDAASDAGGDSLALAFNDAMEEFDPLVNFSLRVRCDLCGEESEQEIDLEEYALGRLRRAQQRLLATVHRLASRYKWDERQIFSVPHWRRSYYLALIDGEKRKGNL